MEPVLPIAAVEYDKTVDKTGDVSNFTAEQYMSWVRDQSQRLPVVFRSEKVVKPVEQTKTMPVVKQVLSCPEEFLPDIDWEREIIHNFSLLRQVIESQDTLKERKIVVPQLKDRLGWLQFCLGNEVDHLINPPQINIPFTTSEVAAPSTNNDVDNNTENQIKRRKLDLASSMGISLEGDNEDGECIEQMEGVPAGIEEVVDVAEDEENDEDDENGEDETLHLEGVAATLQSLTAHSLSTLTTFTSFVPSWTGLKQVKPAIPVLLQFDQVLTQKLLKYLIDYLENIPIYSFGTGIWIYALLARIEKPIHRDMVASIRQLYRRCCELRNELCASLPHRTIIPKKGSSTVTKLTQSLSTEEEEDGEIMEEETPKEVEQEDDEVAEEEGESEWKRQLAALNMLIAITGYYFGQGEHYQDFVSYQDYLLQKTENPSSVAASTTFPTAATALAPVLFSKEDFEENDDSEEEDMMEEMEEC